MALTERQKTIIVIVLLTVIACECALGFAMNFSARKDPLLGSAMAVAMYDYGDDVASVEEGYTWLCNRVDRESWESIRIDNPLRYPIAYSKFRDDTVHILPVFDRPGIGLYSIQNIYIDPDVPWVVTYDYLDSVVCNLREYKLVGWITTPEGAIQ